MKYQVAGYGVGLWCIVDSTRFLGERERLGHWPMQVHEHPLVGRISPFASKDDAQRMADKLNESNER